MNSGYGRAGEKLWHLALRANERGIYYPVWGTCLGFELLTVVAANETRWLTKCNSTDYATNLNFENNLDLRNTNLFKNADPYIIDVSFQLIFTFSHSLTHVIQ